MGVQLVWVRDRGTMRLACPGMGRNGTGAQWDGGIQGPSSLY